MHQLIAYSLDTKNYKNWSMYVKVMANERCELYLGTV